VKPSTVAIIKQAVKDFYHSEVVVDSAIPITADIYTKSKLRLDAPKILDKYDVGKNVLLITESDIAHRNDARNIDEWGIFGLGKRPGKICVVSTFRIHNNVSDSLFQMRLKKIVIHEIGHNIGLNHCTNNKRCLMHAANGTIKKVDSEAMWFCEKCRGRLK
jgi:archaemetzincin